MELMYTQAEVYPPQFCSRIICLLENILRTTTETRCIVAMSCQELAQLNSCVPKNNVSATSECISKKGLKSSEIRSQICTENYPRENENMHRPLPNIKPALKLGRDSENPYHLYKDCVDDTSSSVKFSRNLVQIQKSKTLPSHRQSLQKGNCTKKRHVINNIKGLESNNLKSLTSRFEMNGCDRTNTCNCEYFCALKKAMKCSFVSSDMLQILKNHHAYLLETFQKTDDYISSESCTPEKRFINNLSTVNMPSCIEAADPTVRLLLESKSLLLDVLKIKVNENIKIDSSLLEKATILERRFMQLFNFCESASFHFKDVNRKTKKTSESKKFDWSNMSIWNHSCHHFFAAFTQKPFIQYNNKTQWEIFQRCLQNIQQRNLQLQILEMLMIDFVPQLQSLEPTSSQFQALLKIAYSLSNMEKLSVPLFLRI